MYKRFQNADGKRAMHSVPFRQLPDRIRWHLELPAKLLARGRLEGIHRDEEARTQVPVLRALEHLQGDARGRAKMNAGAAREVLLRRTGNGAVIGRYTEQENVADT